MNPLPCRPGLSAGAECALHFSMSLALSPGFSYSTALHGKSRLYCTAVYADCGFYTVGSLRISYIRIAKSEAAMRNANLFPAALRKRFFIGKTGAQTMFQPFRRKLRPVRLFENFFNPRGEGAQGKKQEKLKKGLFLLRRIISHARQTAERGRERKTAEKKWQQWSGQAMSANFRPPPEHSEAGGNFQCCCAPPR